MAKRIVLFLTLAAVLLAAVFAALLFVPKDNGKAYTLTVAKGQGMAAVADRLERDGELYSKTALLGAAYLLGAQNDLHSGDYRLPAKVSAWQILQRLRGKSPEMLLVRIPEGARFAQMRQIINRHPRLRHETADWSDEKLLNAVSGGKTPLSANPEGLFFPDTYAVGNGSDLAVFQAAYRAMQQQLDAAWQSRQSGLPYQNPYELLIMASLIEKETAHEEDRADVAAVFVNRLNKNMRLQTDPTVIYGMGDAYHGKIRKADLQRDTPYNTYTRNGLTPTPIALAGKAALNAAAHPSGADYYYFVSRMDNTGKSQFSRTLQEHNAAVRKYILKK